MGYNSDLFKFADVAIYALCVLRILNCEIQSELYLVLTVCLPCYI